MLDKFGLRRWKHKHLPLEAQRAYSWVDRILVMDNSRGGRRVIEDTKFSTFDLTNWIEETK